MLSGLSDSRQNCTSVTSQTVVTSALERIHSLHVPSITYFLGLDVGRWSWKGRTIFGTWIRHACTWMVENVGPMLRDSTSRNLGQSYWSSLYKHDVPTMNEDTITARLYQETLHVASHMSMPPHCQWVRMRMTSDDRMWNSLLRAHRLVWHFWHILNWTFRIERLVCQLVT